MYFISRFWVVRRSGLIRAFRLLVAMSVMQRGSGFHQLAAFSICYSPNRRYINAQVFPTFSMTLKVVGACSGQIAKSRRTDSAHLQHRVSGASAIA